MKLIHNLLIELNAAGECLQEAWAARRYYPFWRHLRLLWQLRDKDPDLCCCGAYIGQGGDICGHGGCRSAKEYYITESLK